jgi:hypothetical protein
MSTVAPRPPAPPPPPPHVAPALIDSEGYIDDHIQRTRRSLKLVDLASTFITLAIGLLAFLLAAGIVDHWIVPGGLGPVGRAGMFGVLVAGLGWFAWRQLGPLVRSINPVYAAHAIEKTSPSLKNSLLNVLLFRHHRQGMPAKVYHALEQQAAQRLSAAGADATIDHGALLRLGYALVGVIAACTIYGILSPKNLATSAGRIVMPWADIAAPSRVQILDVQPGDATVAIGERVHVSAEILALREGDEVRLRYTTDDESQVDESIAMIRPASAGRFAADLPRAVDASRGAGAPGGAVGVQQGLEYWIEAGDARSRRFRLGAFERPTIVVDRVEYRYPAYTGEPTKVVDGIGDLSGLEGTEVVVEAHASHDIKSAYVDFDSDGRSDIRMTADGRRATATFSLQLKPDRRTPWHINYLLRFTSTEDRANEDPVQYAIAVTPDYPPEVRITAPEEPDLAVRLDQRVPIAVEARDADFAVRDVRLVGRVGDQDIELRRLLDRDHARLFKGRHEFVAADAKLQPGDVLEYWAEARDNRQPEGNLAMSEHRRLRIIDPEAPGGGQQDPNQRGGPQNGDPQNNGDQGDQQQPGGGQQPRENPQGGNNGGDSQPGGQTQQGGQSTQGGQAGASGGEQGDEQAQPGAGTAGDQSGQAGQSGESGQSGSEQSQQNAAGQSGGQGSSTGEGGQQQASGGASQGGPPAGDQPQQGPGDGDSQAAQDGESSAGEQPQGGASQGGQAGAQGGQRDRVAADGHDDGEAFQRLTEQLGDGEAAAGAEGENAQGTAADRPTGEADGSPSGAGSSSGDANQTGRRPREAADTAGNPRGDDGATEGEPPADGSNPDPNGQQTRGANTPRDATDPANAGTPEGAGETAAGADNAGNQNNGAAPAGDEGAGHPGAPEASPRTPRDAANGDEGEQSGADSETPTANARGRTESQARGDQSGDRAGEGRQGGGQQAENAGQGQPGTHEAADTGQGQSADAGDDETGTQGGDQALANGQTGQSSGDQRGAGGSTRDGGDEPGAGGSQGDQADEQQQQAPGGDAGAEGDQTQAGGEASGQPADAGGQQRPGAPGANPAGQQSPAAGEQAGSDAGPSGDEPAGGEPSGGESPAGEQSPGGNPGASPDAGSGPDGGAHEGSQNPRAESPPAGDASRGAFGRGGAASNPTAGGTQGGGVNGDGVMREPGGDQANLEFAKKQTDLVLEKLSDQLAKKQVDPKLLKSLGWTEAELRQFVDRWKGLKAAAAAEGDNPGDATAKLDAALRAIGPLQRRGPLQIRGAATADELRNLNEGYRARTPLEYADRVRAYMKGAASTEEGE